MLVRLALVARAALVVVVGLAMLVRLALVARAALVVVAVGLAMLVRLALVARAALVVVVLVVVVGLAVGGCSKPTARPHDDVRRSPADASVPSDARRDASPLHDASQHADVVLDAAVTASNGPSVTIVDAPIQWSDERERLTLEYRRRHSDPAATDLTIAPKVIVLHFTGGSSAKSTRGYFDHLKIEAARKDLARGGAVNVSAHFLVDRDGTIYRLQPETRFARHCIGLNHIAIGIENVGDEKKYPLTDAQVEADAALVRDLAARFPITHLLGHHEVMKFRDNPYFVELEKDYHNSKNDPGERFMQRVRERVADLKLSGL
jgi:N-acetylmuramoyl-L-alanine amidase